MMVRETERWLCPLIESLSAVKDVQPCTSEQRYGQRMSWWLSNGLTKMPGGAQGAVEQLLVDSGDVKRAPEIPISHVS